jgi:hypothetical protein
LLVAALPARAVEPGESIVKGIVPVRYSNPVRRWAKLSFRV